jgi:ABC-type multidrug transport system ATPase subunit
MSHQQKSKRVEEVILELNLKECANTIIGDTTKKGISGGEKRRVSMGVQMLVDPSILLCDEISKHYIHLEIFTMFIYYVLL